MDKKSLIRWAKQYNKDLPWLKGDGIPPKFQRLIESHVLVFALYASYKLREQKKRALKRKRK